MFLKEKIQIKKKININKINFICQCIFKSVLFIFLQKIVLLIHFLLIVIVNKIFNHVQ